MARSCFRFTTRSYSACQLNTAPRQKLLISVAGDLSGARLLPGIDVLAARRRGPSRVAPMDAGAMHRRPFCTVPAHFRITALEALLTLLGARPEHY